MGKTTSPLLEIDSLLGAARKGLVRKGGDAPPERGSGGGKGSDNKPIYTNKQSPYRMRWWSSSSSETQSVSPGQGRHRIKPIRRIM